jgi:hypothetical protein
MLLIAYGLLVKIPIHWSCGCFVCKALIVEVLRVKYAIHWGYACIGVRDFVLVRKNAIRSLRLRLHSGLRQRGRAFGPRLT